jgi:hypothetical protein
MQRTVTDRERRADLIGDLIALSTALVQLELHDDFAPGGDAPLCEEFVERLLTRRLSNNENDGRLLHLASCEPEAMSAHERQAADALGRPFLASVQFLIVSADELRTATSVYCGETVGRTDADTAIAFERLHLALAATVAALAALILGSAAGAVTLPPFRYGTDLEIANLAAAFARLPTFTETPPGTV